MWTGLAVLSVCGLAGWWLFLRLARHVYDRGGADDLRVLGELAESYRGRQHYRRRHRADGAPKRELGR